MYEYLANDDVLYTDTDSLFKKIPFNKNLIGNKVGEFKLEHGGLIYRAVFVSNKFYCVISQNGVFSTNKGIRDKIQFSEFKKLLKDEPITKKEYRWKRDLNNENIKKEVNLDYVIYGKYEKRKKLYSLGKWIDTTPLFVNEDKIVTTDIVIKK